MPPNQLPVSEAERRILETMRLEFFPTFNKLKETLVRIQATKIILGIYSPDLSKNEQEYFELSQEFFTIDKKLTTLDILFEGIENTDQAAVAYLKYQNAFKQNLADASGCIEIIDRTLDRKRQTLQNNRTLILALLALVVAVFLH